MILIFPKRVKEIKQKQLNFFSLIIALFMLGACSTSPSEPYSSQPKQPIQRQQQPTHTLNEQLQKAESAIEHNNHQYAQITIQQIHQANLTHSASRSQLDRLNIIKAYLLYHQGQYKVALSQLRPLSNPPTATEQRIDALLLSSFCHQALANHELAVTNLINREQLLTGALRIQSQQYTQQVINRLSLEQRQAIIANSNNPALIERIQQTEFSVNQNTNQPTPFTPSLNIGQNKKNITPQWSYRSPKKIAVLLPISSKLNKPAKATWEGILLQHQLNFSIYSPQLELIDIGSDPLLTQHYHQSAINNGADFIIGPLGKTFANQITTSTVPTILLSGEHNPQQINLFRFSLSPENEGKEIAHYTHSIGHKKALVLSSWSNIDTRRIQAFEQHFQQLGGHILDKAKFQTEQFDHSHQIKQLLRIDESERRYKRLSQTLNFKPKFTPTIRQDVDFVLLLADNKSARTIKSQISFYGGHTLPIIMSSQAYNGMQDTANDLDLENAYFPTMPWHLEKQGIKPYLGQLGNLYAMGRDSYLLAANFNALNQANTTLSGQTGQLFLNNNKEINNHFIWAKFHNGIAQPLNKQDNLNELTPTR